MRARSGTTCSRRRPRGPRRSGRVVTPFDPDALVAMLRAFYPQPSGAAFALARAQRPEYFAGGVIFGSKGDKLRLPDGREYDCILAAGGPPSSRAWMCSLIEPGDPGVDDPFALDDGPLAYIDDGVVIFPGDVPDFEQLVVTELGALDGAEGVLDRAGADVQVAADPDRFDGSYRALVDPAREAHVRLRNALDGDDPMDVIESTNAHDGEIDSARGDYVESPPPDTPEPDPGSPPDEPPNPPRPPEA